MNTELSMLPVMKIKVIFNCIPGRKSGILCICHRYAAAAATAAEISCVRSTACSSRPIFFKFGSYVSCTKI